MSTVIQGPTSLSTSIQGQTCPPVTIQDQTLLQVQILVQTSPSSMMMYSSQGSEADDQHVISSGVITFDVISFTVWWELSMSSFAQSLVKRYLFFFFFFVRVPC